MFGNIIDVINGTYFEQKAIQPDLSNGMRKYEDISNPKQKTPKRVQRDFQVIVNSKSTISEDGTHTYFTVL